MIEPIGHPHEEVLHDGTTVLVRPIEPADGAALVRFHEALSAESIRSRYLGEHPHLSAAQTERFTTVDHRDREALVALADGGIIGVGRYERIDDSRDAEVAFVVADDWQGDGIAPIVLGLLAARAREVGIIRLVAETLEGNRPMLETFRHSGLSMTTARSHGVVSVNMML